MNRITINTAHQSVACDVCGRTLLRGESSDVFLHGGSRRSVCELCTSRAVHEGWIREGLDAALGRSPREGTARGLLTRLRKGREATARSDRDRNDVEEPRPAPDARWAGDGEAGDWGPVPAEDLDPVDLAPPEALVPQPAPPAASDAFAEAFHEPRGVHAVPTNAVLKTTRALQVFNVSHHPRTVAGVSRSLGEPIVSAHPSETEGSIVTIVVAWDLSWYRYEIDLGDEAAGVRVIARGSELDELADAEREANATADERGELHPLAGVA